MCGKRSCHSSSDEDILRNKHYKIKMLFMIDEFIWTCPFNLKSYDTHTYVLFDEFIWSFLGAFNRLLTVGHSFIKLTHTTWVLWEARL